MDRAAAIGGDGLPCRGLIEVRVQRCRQRNRVGLNLSLGGWSDQGAGIGDDGSAASVEEVLHSDQSWIEGEGAAGLWSL